MFSKAYADRRREREKKVASFMLSKASVGSQSSTRTTYHFCSREIFV